MINICRHYIDEIIRRVRINANWLNRLFSKASIHMVGQETVASPQDVVSRVQQAAAEEKSSVLLMLVDKGVQRFVAVKFANA